MKKRTILILCVIVFLIAAAFCLFQVIRSSYAPRASRSEALQPEETASAEGTGLDEPGPVQEAETAQPTAELAPEETEAPAEETERPEDPPYVSPIDFNELWNVNPDIYGWLEIRNSEITYPVVQDSEDDTFYLDHNSDREYSSAGAIFSESAYNSKDMRDPVTIFYGHHMRSGRMFGSLQLLYTNDSFFADNPTFTVYTPDAELTYGVFAAVPYPGEHILYYHDFEDENVFAGFFKRIMNTRDLSANFNNEYVPEPGDHVVILSTCLIGNNRNRFLVMGTLLDDLADNNEILEKRGKK